MLKKYKVVIKRRLLNWCRPIPVSLTQLKVIYANGQHFPPEEKIRKISSHFTQTLNDTNYAEWIILASTPGKFCSLPSSSLQASSKKCSPPNVLDKVRTCTKWRKCSVQEKTRFSALTCAMGVPLSVLISMPLSGSTSKRFARISSWKKPGFALHKNQVLVCQQGNNNSTNNSWKYKQRGHFP